MTKMTKQEAVKALADKVKEFEKALSEAESIAMEHDLEFHISPAYGMGGYYDGKEAEWNPSSQSCY